MASPRTEFYAVLDRVEGLAGLYRAQTKVGRPRQPLSDVLRGALVLMISGLDAYVHQSIVLEAPRADRGGRLGNVARRWVANDPARSALPHGTARRAGVREVVRTKTAKTTFQRPEHVDQALAHVGVLPPWDLVAAELSTPSDLLNADDVKAHLSSVVDRRDQVAHHGDRYRHGLRPIRVDYISDGAWLMIGIADGIAKAIAREHP